MKCEEHCQKLLRDYLSKIDHSQQGVCIEVGVGTFALYCVLFAELGYQTIAIEPLVSDDLIQICQKYRINLLESCLSDIDGEATLYIGEFEGHQNTNLSSLISNWWGASLQTIKVSSLSVKTLISHFQITKITCLKIDVEGAEVIILRQLKNLPSLLLPEVIMFEYGGGDSKNSQNKGLSTDFFAQTNECLNLLRECGYQEGVIVDESDVENSINFSFQTQINNNFENLFKSSFQWGNIISFKNSLLTKNGVTTSFDSVFNKEPVITLSTLGKNGRFANQIFQYAFLKIYAQKYNLQVETPPWIGQTLFGHDDPPISRPLPVVYEKSNDLEEAMLPNSNQILRNVDLWGYFQYNTKFYAPYQKEFRSLFRPVAEIESQLTQSVKLLRQKGKTIVGLHLRRGDYGYDCFFIAPNQWYLQWLETIWNTLNEPILFIASDEIDKVKSDFSQYNPITSQDLDCNLSKASFYPDFYLLSQCDILAISNSSFSFAASMLNETSKTFVRPHLSLQKLIAYDPWSSEILLRNDTVDNYKSAILSTTIDWQLTTPIAFFIFNRPETTQKVFDTIRQAKPPKLLVVADGARLDKVGEIDKCNQTREIINQVDWECEVLINYSDINLGCRKRISSGLDWIFQQVEEAIILEDDCLPHPTFFRYCQELLEKYCDHEQIMMISGDNFQFGHKRTEFSYYFSRYAHIWGWATWRRAWTKYDDSMSKWEKLRDSDWLYKLLQDQEASECWSKIFQVAYDGYDTWDICWVFTVWLNQGLCILPNVNLVSNIGFGSGTRTTEANSHLANMNIEAIMFPLQHPSSIEQNIEADDFTEETQYSGIVAKVKAEKFSSSQPLQTCKICQAESTYFATAKILNKYDVQYFQCTNCGFVQTEEPYWINEAYSEAIAFSDVGLVFRNNMLANLTGRLLYNYFDHHGSFLDYGGGYGLFVRLMRDQGFDFYWHDKYCKNIFAKGFEYRQKHPNEFLLITAFELFEHLIDPYQELSMMLELAPNILFSTELLPTNNPKPNEWWYYALHEGQHISIFTIKSLKILAKNNNLTLHTDSISLHLLTNNQNLPKNILNIIKSENIAIPNKESLLSRDFNSIVNSLDGQDDRSEISKNTTSIQLNTPIIIIDGVFFQIAQTGIGRVWISLLKQWSNTEFAHHILVLDRSGAMPKINGIRYRTIHSYDYNDTERDRTLLQQICDDEEAELFISSYYTTPLTTPSVFIAYDMVPEVIKEDLNEPMWREKHHGINHASAHIAISHNTAKDINQFFPEINEELITVAHCGVDPLFCPATESEINQFKHHYGINKPYFLLGSLLGKNKNPLLFFQAFSQLTNKTGFDIIATGEGGQLHPTWRNEYTSGCTFHGLQLTDAELRLAYAGAVALVYPSIYEGFGMPVIEAMACGCPVITTPNASLPEAAGDAAIYVQDNDIEGMANALCDIQKPSVRKTLIQAGLQQAQKFSWTSMAEIVKETLMNTIASSIVLSEINYIIFPDWQESEELLSQEIGKVLKLLTKGTENREILLLIDTMDIGATMAENFTADVLLTLMLEEDFSVDDKLQIIYLESLSAHQWQQYLPKILARIQLCCDNQAAIETASAQDLLTISAEDKNYLIIPDWRLDHETTAYEVMTVLNKFYCQSNQEKGCILINTNSLETEEATEIILDIAVTLALDHNIDISEKWTISLFSDLTPPQWQEICSHLTGRLALFHEEQSLILQSEIAQLTVITLD